MEKVKINANWRANRPFRNLVIDCHDHGKSKTYALFNDQREACGIGCEKCFYYLGVLLEKDQKKRLQFS